MNEGRSPPHCLREAEATARRAACVKGSDPEKRERCAPAALQAVSQSSEGKSSH